MENTRLKVALLGPGMIGLDLLYKIKRSDHLDCTLVVGRNLTGKGLNYAKDLGFNVIGKGIDALIAEQDSYDLVFDATNATSHAEHWQKLKAINKKVIDLTPSNLGQIVVPTETRPDDLYSNNLNLISCGGQASIPILAALSKVLGDVEYVEIITTASSPGVGRATRLNIDEYIFTTQDAIKHFTKIPKAKAILNISAAQPPAPFRVAMNLLSKSIDMDSVKETLATVVPKVQKYAEGYHLITCRQMNANRLYISVEIEGRGDYIPKYSGNLDIINCAGITMAEKLFEARLIESNTHSPLRAVKTQ